MEGRGPGATPASGGGVAQTDPQRMIVRTVTMTLVVESVRDAAQKISDLASGKGGYVASSQVTGQDEASTSGTIAIRVPVAAVEETLAGLRQLAIRVDDEKVASDDVTQEYVDLQARLRAQEAAESQYLALMERAQNVSDVVTVQRELTSVRATIEQIKGRIQFLERSSAMSLITVRLTPKANPQPLADPGWSPNEQVREAVRSLVDFGQYLATVGIWIAVFSPIWLPITIIVLWLSRRSRNAGKTASPVAPGPKG